MPILLDKYVSQVSHQVIHAFHGGFMSTEVQSWRRSHLDVPSSEFQGIRCWKIASKVSYPRDNSGIWWKISNATCLTSQLEFA